MNTDARFQDARFERDLMAALQLESLFSTSGLGIPPDEWESIKPTAGESMRAVANIRAWRAYLPEDCVKSMIEDGWQWST